MHLPGISITNFFLWQVVCRIGIIYRQGAWRWPWRSAAANTHPQKPSLDSGMTTNRLWWISSWGFTLVCNIYHQYLFKNMNLLFQYVTLKDYLSMHTVKYNMLITKCQLQTVLINYQCTYLISFMWYFIKGL